MRFHPSAYEVSDAGADTLVLVARNTRGRMLVGACRGWVATATATAAAATSSAFTAFSRKEVAVLLESLGATFRGRAPEYQGIDAAVAPARAGRERAGRRLNLVRRAGRPT